MSSSIADGFSAPPFARPPVLAVFDARSEDAVVISDDAKEERATRAVRSATTDRISLRDKNPSSAI
jgi:hypothetical protein